MVSASAITFTEENCIQGRNSYLVLGMNNRILSNLFMSINLTRQKEILMLYWEKAYIGMEA